jgi:hypothetical protein
MPRDRRCSVPGSIALRVRDRDGRAIAVVALNIHAVANPEKLRHLGRSKHGTRSVIRM